MQLPAPVTLPGGVTRAAAFGTTCFTGSIDFTWPFSRSTVTRTGNLPGPMSKVSRTMPAESSWLATRVGFPGPAAFCT